MTLFFFRQYLTYELLGFLFDLHESNAFRNVKMMKKFLRKYISLPEKVREKKINSLEDLLKEIPEIELIMDVTKQERQKPKEKRKRKECYSGQVKRAGKKKRHRIKSQVVIEKGSSLILDLTSGYEGSLHDLMAFERSKLDERLGGMKVRVLVDKGYLGIEKIVEGWEIRGPKKKSKGRS